MLDEGLTLEEGELLENWVFVEKDWLPEDDESDCPVVWGDTEAELTPVLDNCPVEEVDEE